MPTGGCYCGAIRYEYTDCKRISGSAFSTNIIVPGIRVTKGQPKENKKIAESGNNIINYFCGDCGTTMFGGGPAYGASMVVKVGSLDDTNAFENAKPAVELFVPQRVTWVAATHGAVQKQSMPDSADA